MPLEKGQKGCAGDKGEGAAHTEAQRQRAAKGKGACC